MSSFLYTTDTSADANAVQLELWRKMTGQQRVEKAMALSSRVRAMAFSAIRRRHPEWNEDQIQLKFIELTYGRELASSFEKWKAEQTIEPA